MKRSKRDMLLYRVMYLMELLPKSSDRHRLRRIGEELLGSYKDLKAKHIRNQLETFTQ